MDGKLSPDGSLLLVGTESGSVQLWDVAKRVKIGERGIGPEPIRVAQFGRRSTQSWAAAGKNVYFSDLESGGSETVVSEESEIVDLRVYDEPPRIVTVTTNGAARLWTKAESGYRPHDPVQLDVGIFSHYDLSSDGALVASGDAVTKAVTVSDLRTGRVDQRIDLPDGVNGSSSAVFSNAGKHLLVGVVGSTALLWDLQNKRQIVVLEGHYDSILKVAFAPDDSMIATGSEDGTVKLWSAKDQFARPVAIIAGFVRGANAILSKGPEIAQVQLREQRLREDWEGAVGHMMFSSDGRRLLTTSGDRSISVWDVETDHLSSSMRVPIARVRGHVGRIDRAGMSADRSVVVSVGRDATARVWSGAPIKDRPLFQDGEGGTQAVQMITAGGKPIIVAKHYDARCGGTWQVWDPVERKMLNTTDPSQNVGHALSSISLDGLAHVSGPAADGGFSVLNLASRSTATGIPKRLAGRVDCAYVAPGGRELLLTGEKMEKILPLSGAENSATTAALYRDEFAASGNAWWLLRGSNTRTLSAVEEDYKTDSVGINRAGGRFLAANKDGTVALYDRVNGREIRSFAGADPRTIKFSVDELYVVGMSTAGVISQWRSHDGATSRELAFRGGELRYLALGGLARPVLAAVGTDGMVRLWDLQAGSAETILPEKFTADVDIEIQISNDGTRVIVEPRESCRGVLASLWSLADNTRVTSFSDDDGCPYRFRFSNDSRQVIASVSEPFRVMVWESEGGGELARRGPCLPDGIEMYDGDPSQITDQRFSDDNEYILAGTLGGATCFWHNPGAGQKLIDRAKGIVPRELTDAERKEFLLSERKDTAAAGVP